MDDDIERHDVDSRLKVGDVHNGPHRLGHVRRVRRVDDGAWDTYTVGVMLWLAVMPTGAVVVGVQVWWFRRGVRWRWTWVAVGWVGGDDGDEDDDGDDINVSYRCVVRGEHDEDKMVMRSGRMRRMTVGLEVGQKRMGLKKRLLVWRDETDVCADVNEGWM